jgi:hypothetical protein
MIDWSFIIGGVLCAWVFLLMLSHERQRRLQEIEAEWAAQPEPEQEIPELGSPPPEPGTAPPARRRG